MSKKKNPVISLPSRKTPNIKKLYLQRWIADDDEGEGEGKTVNFPILVAPNKCNIYEAHELALAECSKSVYADSGDKTEKEIEVRLKKVAVSNVFIELRNAISIVQCLLSGIDVKGSNLVEKAKSLMDYMDSGEVAVIAAQISTKEFKVFT